MSGRLRVHISFSRGKIEHPDGPIFWHHAQRELELGATPEVVLSVRVAPDVEPFDLRFDLTHVTATDAAATFIGEKQGHTITGVVLYRNQRDGYVMANIIPQQSTRR